MSAKRLFSELSQHKEDHEPADQKGMKPRRLSLASVIGKVISLNSMNKLLSELEPWLRRVVNEELKNALRRRNSHLFTRPFPLLLENQAEVAETSSSCLQLMFINKVLPPTLFTASKISDTDNNPLQVFLVSKADHDLPLYPIKIEIVVLNGEFPHGGGETWSSEEFNKNIVKERAGKRPLLAGDQLCVTMKEGVAPVGDIEFTDNSIWIRCRKFRLGAKVVSGSYKGTLRIHEAITEAFMVKDHRGESYKKNHPPMLEDEVWRLEKIGRNGPFHKKLSSQGINSVQDFLKLYVVDTPRLREILGPRISHKMWEVTTRHAMTCVLGNKLYSFQGNDNCVIILNPICHLVGAFIDGQLFPASHDLSIQTNGHIQSLVREAYENWNSLQEVQGNIYNILNEAASLLP